MIDGRLASNDAQGGYTEQTVSLVDTCSIAGEASESYNCMSPSNVHGANRFNRNERMLELFVGKHDMNQYIEIKSMPVVAVSMGVQTSVENFYKIKDAFLSTLAATLGIDVTRITIVDVVAGNARRSLSLVPSSPTDSLPSRRLLAESATVNFEVEPDPEIEITSAETLTVNEDVGILSIEVTRSVNIIGACGASFAVLQIPSDNAEPGVNFVAQTGFVQFDNKEDKKTIQVQILSEPGFRSELVQFTFSIDNAVNASLGEVQAATISLQNVHMPPPQAPRLAPSGTNTSGLQLEWSEATWVLAPSEKYNATVEWEVECETNDEKLQTVRVPATIRTTFVEGGLSPYTEVNCQVRVKATEWSSWSAVATFHTMPLCGDELVQGHETCDDGNGAGGDGCSSQCTVECGFSCSGVGAGSCSTSCGDGIVAGDETCDDANTADEDGCSASCQTVSGWSCPSPSCGTSQCKEVCGNGVRTPIEECDDSNTDANDGCTGLCQTECGYTCSGTSPDVCSSNCGDGVQASSEGCDDGNLNDNDGCSSSCSIENGFSCTLKACFQSKCSAVCGDEQMVGLETCDDGNGDDDDGCSARCSVECGYTCTGTGAGSCSTTCGDGVLSGTEGCDDGNTVAGDGCSSSCVVEGGYICGKKICGQSSCTWMTGNEKCGDGKVLGAEVRGDLHIFCPGDWRNTHLQ